MLQNQAFFTSWSGGKDSCLALYYAVKSGGVPQKLLTMFTEGGERSRSHGLPIQVIEAQAHALGIELVTGRASWQTYEQVFIQLLKDLKTEGISVGVYGDIDLDDHLHWVQRVSAKAGVEAHHPLWKQSRRHLLMEFLQAGFTASIVAVKDGVMDQRFLGQTLTPALVEQIESLGIDASGEEGEFHTVVTSGPLFAYPIQLELKEQILLDGYWFQDVALTPEGEE